MKAYICILIAILCSCTEGCADIQNPRPIKYVGGGEIDAVPYGAQFTYGDRNIKQDGKAWVIE